MKTKKQKQSVLYRDRDRGIEMSHFGSGYSSDDQRLERLAGHGLSLIFWAMAEGWIRMDCTAGSVGFVARFLPAELKELAKIISHLAEVADEAIRLKSGQPS